LKEPASVAFATVAVVDMSIGSGTNLSRNLVFSAQLFRARNKSAGKDNAYRDLRFA
jgi:hypothetical protein